MVELGLSAGYFFQIIQTSQHAGHIGNSSYIEDNCFYILFLIRVQPWHIFRIVVTVSFEIEASGIIYVPFQSTTGSIKAVQTMITVIISSCRKLLHRIRILIYVFFLSIRKNFHRFRNIFFTCISLFIHFRSFRKRFFIC